MSAAQIFSKILILLFALGSIALIRDTAHVGVDFEVFWRAAQYFVSGQPLYDLARDGGMVFKYPPWMIVFFAPLAFFSMTVAKWIWGLLQVGCLIFIVRWLRARSVSLTVCLLVWLLFWGLWVKHALTGQVSLMILVASLYAFEHPRLEKFNARSVVLFLALSTKVFTMVPLFFRVPTRAYLKTFFKLAAVTLGLMLLTCAALDASPLALTQSWMEAAGSGGSLLPSGRVRSSDNAGIPGLLLMLLRVPGHSALPDIFTFAIVSLIVGGAWVRLSRHLKPEVAWLGWLSLLPAIHPLPWWHLFVFAYPAAAYSLDLALKQKRAGLVALSCAGIFLIGFSSESILGDAGLFLRQWAAKSWGSLIGAFVLARASLVDHSA